MKSTRKVLVTGGCGYIGSHTCLELLQAGYEVVVIDNLINGYTSTLENVSQITGKKISFYELDTKDETKLTRLLKQESCHAVLHFAGLKSPTESLQKPLAYFNNNICGMLALLNAMQANDVQNLIFSSTAAVYGVPKHVPVAETAVTGDTINPYAESKLAIENILKSYSLSNTNFKSVILRYFNPIGAHESGLIGESPKGIPNNLMPHICRVACGDQDKLKVFGNDYDTPDGTGVRDYIHVVDLADGHLSALKYLENGGDSDTFNLGTGSGYSVLELINSFESISGKHVPLEFVPRRKGDVANCYADVERARQKLNWTAKRDLREMCADAWRWQKNCIEL